jgi:hypothetical protein
MLKFIPARKVAAVAIAAHPNWSNRKLAELVGVGHHTIHRNRPHWPNAPKQRLGRDGKRYPSKRRT